jgi:hypothetical protein
MNPLPANKTPSIIHPFIYTLTIYLSFQMVVVNFKDIAF